MRALIDTSVWSLALRRPSREETDVVNELKQLIADGRALTIGPIRQEILSGIRSENQFESVARHLAAFPDLALTTEDYVMAARFFNLCRSKGVQGSNTDFLICAVSVRHRTAIFTTDRDFDHFARHLPITLHNRA